MKKFFLLLAVLSFSAVVIFPISASAKEKQNIDLKSLTMVTSPIGGVWYTAGAKIGEIFQNTFNLRVTVDVGSSAQNVIRVNAGKDADFGMASTPEVWNGYHGLAPFKTKLKNIRLLGTLGQWCFQVLVRKGSGIHSWKDLRTKHYAPAAVGSGSEILSRYILKEEGLSYEKVREAGGTIEFRSFSNSVQAMKDGNLDAMAISSLYPVPIYQEYLLTNKGYFLSISKSLQKKLIAKYPAYIPAVIPAGTYKGQNKPIETLSYYAVFVVRADLPDSVVYKLTKALYQNQSKIQGLMAGLKGFGVKNATEWRRIPFHPGAIKYFKEVGVWK